MESRLLIAEPDPDSDQILVFSVTTRCKRLIVKVGDKEVVIERSKDKLVVKKDGAYTTKRVTIRYPSNKPYLFYTKTADGVVEIEAEALY
jgi:3-methyladenine DNA glycosylase Mpg